MNEPDPSADSAAPHLVLQGSVALPCGVILENRLAKAAMSDSLGDGKGDPTALQARLYERWAQGGVALSIIGEVQGDPRFPEKPGNVVFSERSDERAIQSLVRRAVTNGAHLWPQLGHAGALSHPPISRPRGPSALDIPGLRCDGMSTEEVEALPRMYARAAAFAKKAGFSGVHLHAGHGFLLSQFLSPLFNHRSDHYGGSIEARCHVVMRIVDAVRREVGASFPIGIKINATDKLQGGLTEDDALEVVRLLDRSTIDLIDISGGTYFPGAKASSDGVSGDGPYFLAFARRARAASAVPLMLTGGFERREQAVDAIAGGAVDVIGLARAMVLNPCLANDWLGEEGGDPEFPRFDAPPHGGVTAWYSMRLTALAQDSEAAFTLDPRAALEEYEARDAKRCAVWTETFRGA